MNLTPWRNRNPSSLMTLQNEMNQMFEDFFSRPSLFTTPARTLAPARVLEQVQMDLDVKEDDNTITVTAELPGVKSKDIEINVQDDVLEIKGHKSEEQKRDEENFHMIERSYGSFARRILLPAQVDDERAEAKMDNGVLTLQLPKTGPKSGKKSIQISSSS